MGLEPCRVQYVARKGDPLFSMFPVVSVGFDSFDAGARSEGPRPKLSTLALAATTSGEATLYAGEDAVRHAPGSVMVMLPDLAMHEVAGPGVWKTHWTVLHGPLPEACVAQMGMRSRAVVLSHVPGRIRSALFEVCRLVAAQPGGWQWAWLRHVTAVLDYVQERLSRRGAEAATLAGRARTLMRRHLRRPLPLPEIARRLHVSMSTLSHGFKEETGAPPGLAYRRMRIGLARQLLASGLNVKETSRELGFENPFHFSRLFRRIEGVAPRAFRRQHMHPPLRRQ